MTRAEKELYLTHCRLREFRGQTLYAVPSMFLDELPRDSVQTIDLSGGTAFQQAVWRALLSIAPGCTASYADISQAVGNPAAVRAVGAAVGRNPVSIIVPCHRVVGTDGSLTGYAGGLDRKTALLRLEGALNESLI